MVNGAVNDVADNTHPKNNLEILFKTNMTRGDSDDVNGNCNADIRNNTIYSRVFSSDFSTADRSIGENDSDVLIIKY